MQTISSFSGKFHWLSNFYSVEVEFDGLIFPSVENAYQASKTTKENRSPFIHYSAKEAKKEGRKVELIDDWDKDKISVMRNLIQKKFAQGTELAQMLIDTGNSELIEGNWWGDTFWGVCRGVGKNNLGKMLMQQRLMLRLIGNN